MSDTATDLTPAPDQTPPPEPEQIAQPQGDGDPAPLNIDDDAAVDAALESAAIPLPDGDKLVAVSEAGKVGRAYREKIKELRGELANAQTTAAEAATLKQQIAQLQSQLQQQQPYISAYQAMTQAAQQAAPAEDDTEATEFARELDLYTPDGQPDVARAKKTLARLSKMAGAEAQKHVAPIQQHTVQSASAANLARAKNTTLPNGTKVDGAVLDHIWRQLDPALTATPEGAQQAFVAALGYSVLGTATAAPQQQAQRAPNGQFASQQTPPPMFVEKAGGKEGGNNLPLSPQELKYIKDSGMSEKDYLASTPPWMRK